MDRDRTRAEVADALQAPGIEAVPVAGLRRRASTTRSSRPAEHFVPLEHPVMGDGLLRAQRLPAPRGAGGYDRAGPTLGQDNDWVLGELLGLSADEQARLRDVGAVE